MLEKVAEAIARQMAEDENDNIDIARAALKAIREVPESISNAAVYDEYDWAGRNFTAMIDAILNEKP
jgi:hypothetical protein